MPLPISTANMRALTPSAIHSARRHTGETAAVSHVCSQHPAMDHPHRFHINIIGENELRVSRFNVHWPVGTERREDTNDGADFAPCASRWAWTRLCADDC